MASDIEHDKIRKEIDILLPIKPYYENENGKLYCSDVLDGIKQLPDLSVNCVITSPAYWQLRDYGYPGQWGLEPTYQKYLKHLWQLMDEIRRVLKDDGTVWINLGDSYTGSGGSGSSEYYPKHTQFGKLDCKDGKYQPPTPKQNIVSKCLLLIPHRFAIGCIDRGWIIRNDIIWAKRNGMPESVTDRFSKKHEYFFFMVKNQKYYFNLDGVRDQYKQSSIERSLRGVSENNKWVNGPDGQTPHNLSQPRPNRTTKISKDQADMFGSPRARYHRENGYKETINPIGKNPGDVSDFWDIPTKPSSKKHYATYNFSLIDKCIIAGCPEGGKILDPFNGIGTTTLRAEQLNRKWIGIDGSKKYCEIAKKIMENEIIQMKFNF